MAEAVAPLGSDPLDLSDLAHLVAVAPPLHLAELADLVQEAPPLALAHVVVEAAQLLQFLCSQSFSASKARKSLPPVQPTYERAPSTK